MKKVAVVLSGCGFMDGSEIHESVLCLLCLEQEGFHYHCFAPDLPQSKVVDHYTKEEVAGEKRNILHEAARIARGKISPLNELDPEDYDAILLPGGFGAASNLSTYATEGENCTVNEDLKEKILQFIAAKKPVGAACIAPAVIAKSLEGTRQVTMTLGSNAAQNENLAKMGMNPRSASVDEMVADEENRVYTTPCYMEHPDLAGMYEGVKQLVEKLR